jgi:hypothetical protein
MSETIIYLGWSYLLIFPWNLNWLISCNVKKPTHTYDVLAKQFMCSCTIIRPRQSQSCHFKTSELIWIYRNCLPVASTWIHTHAIFVLFHVTQLFSFPCFVCLHSVSCAKCWLCRWIIHSRFSRTLIWNHHLTNQLIINQL